MEIKLKKLHPDAKIPTYANTGDACLDLHAVEDVEINSGEIKAIRSGWAMEIPDGFYVEIRPRSGLSVKKQLIIPNSPGTIDATYRGELVTYMKNLESCENNKVIIRKGDRYAQMMLKSYIYVQFEEVNELTPTERGDGGFGSTGR